MFDINQIKILQDYQKSNFYRAKVISLEDPLNLNRIIINIFGMTDDIPDDCLPWCEMIFPSNITIYPQKNDIIWIFFENGDILRPHFIGVVYEGIDIDSNEGYKKYTDNLSLVKKSVVNGNIGYDLQPVINSKTYKSALRVENKITLDEDLVLKNTISHFDVLDKGSTWWKKFSGISVVESANLGTIVASLDAKYSECPFPANTKMYPWYELRESANGSICGGWRFLTESQMNKGLAVFPDSAKRVYLKRYINWCKLKLNEISGSELNGHPGLFSDALPKTWDFLPSSPSVYWDPEMVATSFAKGQNGDVLIEGMNLSQAIPPFPFGKMKINKRKFYKQSSWFSYDNKSSIELDDNDRYERLALNFNYGNGGLEFSSIFPGLEMWTKGVFKITGWGNSPNGSGGIKKVPNLIEALNSDMYISAASKLILVGEAESYLGGMGPVGVRSKLSSVSITGAEGISLGSMDGNELGRGILSAANEGISSGTPIITGNDGATGSPLNGYFPFLQDVPKEIAIGFGSGLQLLLISIIELAKIVSIAVPATTPENALFVAAKVAEWGGSVMMLQDIAYINAYSLSFCPLMSSWDGISMEGSGRG